jgi:HEAT repeat protein
MLATLALFLLMLMPPAANPASPQEQNFIPVEGASLQAKQQSAAQRATAAATPRAPYWTAYSFDVRPGVATDFEFVGDDGSRINIEGSSFFSFDTKFETRNLAVFLLRHADAPDTVTRVEVYNLERKREYGGYPVYWAGRATNEESLNYLRDLAESTRAVASSRVEDVAASATRAIALHDDRRVPSLLETLARSSNATGVRAQAVRSLGHITRTGAPAPPFLLELARNEREPTDLRRAAISALGQRRDPASLGALESLYDALAERELKRSALSAIARNENRNAAASFLIRVAEREADMELKKRAIMQLGEIAGAQALGALESKATQPDADTQLQVQAVSALSRRPAPEAVPLLIKIARTHPKPEVRKQAFLLLGRTGDPAAVSFLREVLAK